MKLDRPAPEYDRRAERQTIAEPQNPRFRTNSDVSAKGAGVLPSEPRSLPYNLSHLETAESGILHIAFRFAIDLRAA